MTGLVDTLSRRPDQSDPGGGLGAAVNQFVFRPCANDDPAARFADPLSGHASADADLVLLQGSDRTLRP